MEETQTLDVDAEAGTETQPLEEGGTTLGGDLIPSEPAAEPSEPQADDPPGDEGFDIDSVDLLSVDVSRIPEQYRPLQKYARRWQGDVDRLREDVRREQEAAKAERQQYLEAIQRVGQPQEAQPQDPLSNLELSPTERQGLEILKEQMVSPLARQLEEVTKTLSELQNGITATQEQTQAEQAMAVQAEITEMQTAYPEASSEDPRVQALVRVQNPATQQHYTFKEAYELVTGITAQNVEQMKAKHETIRRSSPAPRAPAPATSADGKLSLTEAYAEMGKLNFE